MRLNSLLMFWFAFPKMSLNGKWGNSKYFQLQVRAFYETISGLVKIAVLGKASFRHRVEVWENKFFLTHQGQPDRPKAGTDAFIVSSQ